MKLELIPIASPRIFSGVTLVSRVTLNAIVSALKPAKNGGIKYNKYVASGGMKKYDNRQSAEPNILNLNTL